MDLVRTSAALTRDQKLAVCPLASVKAQARVTHNSEDELISDHIEAAYDFLSGPDGWLGRCCLLTETWEAFFASSPVGPSFEAPMRPLVSIQTFGSLATDGSYAAVPAETYLTALTLPFGAIQRVQPGFWPYTGLLHPRAYRMTFTAGFGTAADVPTPIKQGIRMLAAYWFRNRETVGQVQQEVLYGLRALCGRYRVGPDHS